MENKNSQENRFNMEEFAKNSRAYYNELRPTLEAESKGKYVALDFETKKIWIGDTATDALTKAKEEFPNKLFYLLQIGAPAPFNIQSISIRKPLSRKYDFAGAY